MSRLPFLLAPLLLVGCPRSVTPEFRTAKTAALSHPGAPPADWQPDLVLHIGHDALGKLLTKLLATYGTLDETFDAGVAGLHPALSVEQVRLGRGSCDDCLGVGATLSGPLEVRTALGRTEVPLTIDAAFDAALSIDERNGAWSLSVSPRGLQDLDVDIGGMGLGYARKAVRGWVDRSLLASVPPQEITTLGGDELPVRGMRVVPGPRALQVHVLTDAADSAPVPIDRVVPEGWQVDVAPRTLVALAAARAYAAEPLARDIVPVPTSLALDGPRFTLGLRLWRVKGRGWWRDYDVTGRVTIEKNRLHFNPREADQVAKSPGATFADPLAALGKGVILKTLESALETTLPATHRQDAEGLRTRVRLQTLTGTDERISATGKLVIREVPHRTSIDTRRSKAKSKRGKRP